MLGKLKGYCFVKSTANGQSPLDLNLFRGKICRALEINKGSKSVLLIGNGATGLGMFDLSEIESYFECQDFGGILIPANLNPLEATIYAAKVNDRNKGKDLSFLTKMVISHSLGTGKFEDQCYFIGFKPTSRKI